MLKRFLFTLIALFTFLGAQAQAGFPKPTFKASFSKTQAKALGADHFKFAVDPFVEFLKAGVVQYNKRK
jgi:hypothetical protein